MEGSAVCVLAIGQVRDLRFGDYHQRLKPYLSMPRSGITTFNSQSGCGFNFTRILMNRADLSILLNQEAVVYLKTC